MSIIQLPITETRTASDLPGVRDGRVRGLYIHIPFCFHKCHYCDFYSIVDSQDRQQLFVNRLIKEISTASTFIQNAIDSIFVGGGTPTLLSVSHWDRILDAIDSTFKLTANYEFTVEANPETVTPELADCLAAGGVNRASVGAQSFHPHLLETLERHHNPKNVGRAIDCLRGAGITNVNIDLIFGIPGQTLDEWIHDLAVAAEHGLSHLSCYGLMYEPNTALTQRLNRGEIERIDEEIEAAMYERALEVLEGAGFEHYEISNWALPGLKCQHNLHYWRNADWWPIGPSASGHVGGVRWKNIPRLSQYLDSTDLPPIQDVEQLDDDGRLGEALMLRLRLREGLDESVIERCMPSDGAVGSRRRAMDRHLQDGLLERVDGRIRLSRSGLLLADRVLSDLV